MRFRGSVEFWVDVTNPDQVERVVRAADQAAYAAPGGTAIDDPDVCAVSGSQARRRDFPLHHPLIAPR